MADKTYVTAIGTIQQFGADKPVCVAQDVNGQTVQKFTIRTGSQVLLSITLWEELAHIASALRKGQGVMVEGSYTESQGQNGQVFRNISASTLVVIPTVQRVERAVENAVQAAPVADVAPAAAAAPTASPYSF